MMLMAPFLEIILGLLLASQPIGVVYPVFAPLPNDLRETAEGSFMKRHVL